MAAIFYTLSFFSPRKDQWEKQNRMEEGGIPLTLHHYVFLFTYLSCHWLFNLKDNLHPSDPARQWD